MRVILEVVAGPAIGRRFPMQHGERAKVGRGSTADISFPEDPELADLHFELECQPDGYVLRNLVSASQTLLNGEPVEQAEVQHGDTISAGQTRISVSVPGGVRKPAEEEPSVEADENAETPKSPGIDDVVAPTSLPELCQLLKLDEPIVTLAGEHKAIDGFVQALAKQKLFLEAVQVLAYALPRREAIRWAHQCVTEQGVAKTEEEQAALAAAAQWVEEPTEKHRRAAQQASEAAGKKAPPGWIATAVFWSDGSLTPPGLPPVPPDPLLGNQAVSAALLLLATQGDPLQAEDRYRQILEAGRACLAGANGPS